MLVKDETKYCWVDDETAGEPQDSIKDAIADYLEYISELCDVGDIDHSYLGGVPDIEVVDIGHPYYYKPIVNGKEVINDMVLEMDEEIFEYSDRYMKNVKGEHIDALSEELSKVFQAWEKRHGYENGAFVVQETKTYRISDYIDK